MLKINLNELKQFKAIRFNSTESGGDDIDYFYGFIERVYAEDGKIIFKVYGVKFPYDGELRHTELEIDMQDISDYKKSIEETYTIYYNHMDEPRTYTINDECLDISTHREINLSGSIYTAVSSFKLFKSLDFRYLMRQFYETTNDDMIASIESLMLMDEYVFRLVNIPKDYGLSNINPYMME